MSSKFFHSFLVPLAALLCALIATGSCEVIFIDDSQPITGEYARLDDFKFLARVHVEQSYHCDYCLGVKLSDWAVLVPARCLNNRDDIQASVRVKFDCRISGRCDFERGVDEILLEQPSIMHPADSPGRYAVIKMNATVQYRGVDKARLMWNYYGHSDDWHYTVGFEKDTGGIKWTKFRMERQGEFLVPEGGQIEVVSQLGSPILIRDAKDNNRFKLVGIVSNVEGSFGHLKEYRNLHDENNDITRMVGDLSPTPSIEADEETTYRHGNAVEY